jgi:hypothetical protein
MNDSAILLLKRKITLASMAAILAAVAALIIAINYVNYRQTMANLHDVMEEIAASTDGDRNKGEREMVGEKNDEFMHHGGRQSADVQYGSRFFFVILGSDGTVFVKNKGNEALTDEEATSLAERVGQGGPREGVLDDYLYSVETMDDGDGVRILFLDCTTETQSLRQLLTISIIVGAVAFLIASGFVFHFAGLAVRPLEESTRKQKRFVADASHELKTPLSVIATNMDILEVDLEDQPDELEWVDSTNRQVQNMRDLVNDLIALSKMEEGEIDLVFSDVSLSDVADECVYTFRAVAHAQGKNLTASIDEDLHTRGDEPSIRQLMTILIDNAVKYATGDGIVWVALRREGKQAVFETRNAWARNVDPKELDSLFDRFVRGDSSRDRSGGTSGHGLGLSIARVIAERNHAKLEASEDDHGCIVFRATFKA